MKKSASGANKSLVFIKIKQINNYVLFEQQYNNKICLSEY